MDGERRDCQSGSWDGSCRRARHLFLFSNFGAGEWTRTIDLLITNQLLYQLSYAGQAGSATRIAGRRNSHSSMRSPPGAC